MNSKEHKNFEIWSSVAEILLKSGNIWNHVMGAVKEAFFPTRCLVCRSFFRNNNKENSDLKTFFQTLNCSVQSFLDLEKFFQQNDPSMENVGASLGMEAKNFTELMSPFICSECASTYLTVESPICSTCGIVFRSREGEDHHCGECLDTPKKFRMARSAGVYDNVLMATIHCLKYREKVQLARPLSIILFRTFCRYWDKKKLDLIVPVPLHKKKFRTRGFNTSFLLVKEWTFLFKALSKAMPLIPIAGDILLRKKWTNPQTGLGRKERLKNIKNAFGVSDSSKIKGKKILLVDDVYTTGATANECAKALMEAGALCVDVLTLARAM